MMMVVEVLRSVVAVPVMMPMMTVTVMGAEVPTANGNTEATPGTVIRLGGIHGCQQDQTRGREPQPILRLHGDCLS
jgi:hypothetical protein